MFLYAQNINTPPLKFERIPNEKGMSHSHTLTMFKDSKGFLWITTIDGINRFDGYEFKIFRNNPYDSNTICKDWPAVIVEDDMGIIWLTTNAEQGLNSYNPATGKFKRYHGDPFYKNILPDIGMNAVYPDANNILWISTDGKGLLKFNHVANNFFYYKHDALDAQSIHSDYPSAICRADSDHLYIANSDGFDLFDMRTEKFRHIKVAPVKGTNLIEQKCSILKDSKNNLWLCGQQGLKMFDPTSEKIIEYRHIVNDIYSISSDTIYNLCEAPDGKLWIITSSGVNASGCGLNVFDPATKRFSHYKHDASDPSSISTNDLWSVISDSSGKVWIQSVLGIESVDLRPHKFEVFTHNEKDKNSIADNWPQHIFQDSRGTIFICLMYGKGIDVFHPETKTFSRYQPDAQVNKYFSQSRVDYMMEDRQGNYWVNADLNKTIRYNPVTHHAEVFHYRENHHPDSIGMDYDFGMYQDKNNLMWFGGSYKLCSYNPATRKFKSYLIDPKMPGTDINNIGKFFDWDDGKMWMISGGGLAYYDQKKDTMIAMHYRKNKAGEIIRNYGALSFLKEKKNVVWLGTFGQGLFLLNVETGDCINITINDGLPNGVIWGIMRDCHNILWILTNNGLCRYTPSIDVLNFKETASKGIFRNYNVSDGLPGNAFSWNVFMQAKDGYMYFGFDPPQGLMRFHPDSLKDNSFIPKVYITHFSINNREVFPSDTNQFLKQTIETTKEITLSYRENVFSFGFAALSFVHPENNHYAYMLENFDRDWIYTDASKRFANYTNLDAGEYFFKAKASNNDDMWNETPTVIKLIITPPFWLTWWFRSLVVAAVAIAIYSFYRFRLQQILKLQNIRNKIAGDLHDDIGSTLNSISVYSEVARTDKASRDEALEMIGDSSRKIIDAMSDIVWTINPVNDSFTKIIFRMRSLSYNLLRAKKIDFTFRADDSLNEVKLSMTERQNFYLIFKEALNNLVKYSNASRAEIRLTYENKLIELLIRDNGKGFDTTKRSTGNGLNNMNRRAKEINAQLKIESSIGSGTSIKLVLKT